MNDFVIETISGRLQQGLKQGVNQVLGNPVTTVVADAKPGYPCRLSLEDAEVGEELYLFSHSPFPMANPYRETGPVYVRKNAAPASLAVNEIPEIALARSIIVRAYSAAGTMVSASPAASDEIVATIRALFQDKAVEFVHLRAAVTGCFLCEARRA
jgi:hypothetical protein